MPQIINPIGDEPTKYVVSYKDVHMLLMEQPGAIHTRKINTVVSIAAGGAVGAAIIKNTALETPVMISTTVKSYEAKERSEIKVLQGFDESAASHITNSNVLIIDDIDDSRATLLKTIGMVKEHNPTSITVLVLYNKDVPKAGPIPTDVKYIACEDIPRYWVVFPWEVKAF